MLYVYIWCVVQSYENVTLIFSLSLQNMHIHTRDYVYAFALNSIFLRALVFNAITGNLNSKWLWYMSHWYKKKFVSTADIHWNERMSWTCCHSRVKTWQRLCKNIQKTRAHTNAHTHFNIHYDYRCVEEFFARMLCSLSLSLSVYISVYIAYEAWSIAVMNKTVK